MDILNETRRKIAHDYSSQQLFNIATITGLSSVARRNETPELKERFFERMDSWRKL